MELIANLLLILSQLLFYSLWGIPGLAIALSFSYLVMLPINYFIVHKKYDFRISSENKKFLAIQFVVLIIIFYVQVFVPNMSLKIIINSILLLSVITFNIRKLLLNTGILNKFR